MRANFDLIYVLRLAGRIYFKHYNMSSNITDINSITLSDPLIVTESPSLKQFLGLGKSCVKRGLCYT